MRIRSAIEIEDPAAGAEPSNREHRIKAGYRKLLRAGMDGKGGESKVQSLKSVVRHPKRGARAAEVYLSRFLCVGFALALAATGCARPRPLKGGSAVTTRKPTGIVEQTLVQGENPAQATKQDQETIKVRTYTVPAGSRIDQSQPSGAVSARPSTINSQSINHQPSPLAPLTSSLPPQPSATFVLSAPIPVVEREETHSRTELGAAQKDVAREVGAKLASLKGIVWVGIGLFVFGLASLVYPPLKVVVGSVTTSAALMLGGVALMVLPSLIVGNELLLLGAVALSVSAWFLAHRHGQLRGTAAASTRAQSIAPPPAPQNDSPHPSPAAPPATAPATAH